jgi:hypothetical protein
MAWGVLTWDIVKNDNYNPARDAAIGAAAGCGLKNYNDLPNNTCVGNTSYSCKTIADHIATSIKKAGGEFSAIYCYVDPSRQGSHHTLS